LPGFAKKEKKFWKVPLFSNSMLGGLDAGGPKTAGSGEEKKQVGLSNGKGLLRSSIEGPLQRSREKKEKSKCMDQGRRAWGGGGKQPRNRRKTTERGEVKGEGGGARGVKKKGLEIGEAISNAQSKGGGTTTKLCTGGGRS